MLETLSTRELLRLPRVRIEDVAKYLQHEMTCNELRVRARAGVLPFISVQKNEGSSRYIYRIHVGKLIQYKFPDGVPEEDERLVFELKEEETE